MQYLDADDPENLISSASVPNSLDRNAITLDNSISFAPNPHTIFPMGDLRPRDPVDENADKTWWQLNWRKAVQWISFTVMLVTSVVLACIPGTQVVGVTMLIAGAKAALSGFIAGAIIGGIVSAIAGSNFWQGVLDGAVNGAIDGFTTGAIMGLVQGLATMQQVKPANVCTEKNSNCFIAGTLVACLTVDGRETHKPIEEVQVGDMVLSFDEESQKSAYKPVLRVFRNETDCWCTVKIESENGLAEITSTPGHKYYVPESTSLRELDEVQEHASYYGLSEKWVSAKNLKTGDKVLLSDGTFGVVQSVNVKNLSSPETTYNLEVADFHTYYVTESNVLVHNTCKRAAMRSAKRSENIPTNQKPDEIIIEKAVRGENGHFYKPVTYKFGDKFIRNDFGGHKFLDGSTMGRHFNAGRIVEGNYVGNKLHFFY